MKKRNLIILLSACLCVALALTLFVLARRSAAPATTAPPPTQAEESTTAVSVPDCTLALSEYRAYLTWKAVDGADGYYVYHNDGSEWVQYGKTEKCAFRSKGLKGGTAYRFEIRPYVIKDGKQTQLPAAYSSQGTTLPETPKVTVTRDGNTCRLSWDAVRGAARYTVYSMAQDADTWVREGQTQNTSFSFETDSPSFFTAVRAVREWDGNTYLGDYVKTLVSDAQPSGTLCSYGDSVATGVGSHSYSYAHLYAEAHHLKLYNRATTGAQLASSDPKQDHIADSILEDTNDYDYLFIEGGNNDYYFCAEPGKAAPAGSRSFDKNTTCGALEAALCHLKENHPQTKIVFILIHNASDRATTPNDSGYTYNDYAEGIRAVCRKYGVAVADCLKDSGLNTAETALADRYTHHFNGVFPSGDGVHPTEEAYRKFYLPLIEKAANSNLAH